MFEEKNQHLTYTFLYECESDNYLIISPIECMIDI